MLEKGGNFMGYDGVSRVYKLSSLDSAMQGSTWYVSKLVESTHSRTCLQRPGLCGKFLPL